MYSKTRKLETPLQALNVGVPAGLYGATLCCYIAYQGSADPLWFRAGFVANLAGMGIALVVAVPGFLEWLLSSSLRVCGRYLTLNFGALLAFTVCAWIHDGSWEMTPPDVMAGIALCALGLGLIAAGGWLAWDSAWRSAVREDRAIEPVPIDLPEDRRQRHAA